MGKHIFWRFTISYLFILISTVLIGSIFYTYAIKAVQQYFIDSSLLMLEHSSDLVDTRLQEVANYARQFAYNDDIKSFLNINNPLSDNDYLKLQIMQQKFPPYKATNSFIRDTFVFFPNSDVLLSQNYVSARGELLYRQLVNYEGTNYEQWKNEIVGNKDFSTFWASKSINVQEGIIKTITYLQTIPYEYFLKPSGIIIILIEERKIQELLENVSVNNGGYCYITDPSGNIITDISSSGQTIYPSVSENIKVTGSNHVYRIDGNSVIVQTVSKYNNWKYTAAFPLNTLTKKIEYIKIIYFIIIFSTLLIEGFISIYLAYRNSRPIQDIVKNLTRWMGSSGVESRNGYEFINDSIRNLMSSNKAIKEDMNRQNILLRDNFFEKLLRNGFLHLDELQNNLEYLGVSLEGQSFGVVIINIEGYKGVIDKEILKDLNDTRFFIRNIILKGFAEKVHFHDVDDDKTAVIFMFNNNEEYYEFVNNVIILIIKEIEPYNILLRFGIGRQYTRLIDISQSFEEAITSLEIINVEDNKIIKYKDIKIFNTEYYYPLEVEAKLINLVKAGDKIEVHNVLNVIYEKNREMCKMDNNISKQLIYELYGTIIKLKSVAIENSKEIQCIYSSTNNKKSFNTTYEEIIKIFDNLADKNMKMKERHNTKLYEEILKYIDNEYADQELYMGSIAAKFGLAEKYLSRFFKKQSNETLVMHLEKIRMEHAKELLNDTHDSIKEVADKVGYLNVNTFYKSFKKVYGVSPTTYREGTKQ